jgi:hypothetical protein
VKIAAGIVAQTTPYYCRSGLQLTKTSDMFALMIDWSVVTVFIFRSISASQTLSINATKSGSIAVADTDRVFRVTKPEPTQKDISCGPSQFWGHPDGERRLLELLRFVPKTLTSTNWHDDDHKNLSCIYIHIAWEDNTPQLSAHLSTRPWNLDV